MISTLLLQKKRTLPPDSLFQSSMHLPIKSSTYVSFIHPESVQTPTYIPPPHSTPLSFPPKSLLQSFHHIRNGISTLLYRAIHSQERMRHALHNLHIDVHTGASQLLRIPLALGPQDVQLTHHDQRPRLLSPALLIQQGARFGMGPQALLGKIVISIPQHLGRGQRGHELVLLPAQRVARIGGVVRDGHDQELDLEFRDEGWGRRDSFVAHGRGQVAAGGGAADGGLGEVEMQERVARGLEP